MLDAAEELSADHSAAATTLIGPARRVLPGRNVTTRLIELGFHFIGQLQLVFEVIVNPIADCFDLLA